MVDRCVICGAMIPEGRQVCPDCESGRYCNKRGGCVICDRLFCGGVADGMDVVGRGGDRRSGASGGAVSRTVQGAGTDQPGRGASPDPGTDG